MMRNLADGEQVDSGRVNAYPAEGYDIEKPKGLMMAISKACSDRMYVRRKGFR